MKIGKISLVCVSGLLVSVAVGTALQAQENKQVPAYVVVELDVKDPERFQNEYAAKVPATVEQYGGRYIVRGGTTESIEGSPPDGIVAVLSFDSVEDARKWLASPEYSALAPVRKETAETRAYLVEGLPAQ